MDKVEKMLQEIPTIELALRKKSLRDPRTVAHDMPGFVDLIFPGIKGGLTSFVNRYPRSFNGHEISNKTLENHKNIQNSIIFEISFVIFEEKLIYGNKISFEKAYQKAVSNMQYHYDFIQSHIDEFDDELITLIKETADNLEIGIMELAGNNKIIDLKRPQIPGWNWIKNSTGDFELSNTLIEVKSNNGPFSLRDIRQVLLYWILKKTESTMAGGTCWEKVCFINPRRRLYTIISFQKLISTSSGFTNENEILSRFQGIMQQRY